MDVTVVDRYVPIIRRAPQVPQLTSENRNISNGLNGDVSDRYLWVKEKQENALEYLNLSACFIHIVFLAFLVVSARKRSK